MEKMYKDVICDNNNIRERMKLYKSKDFCTIEIKLVLIKTGLL